MASRPRPTRGEYSFREPQPDRRAEYVELLNQHWHTIFNFIFCVVHRFDDAEDIFQQTTFALWADFDKFEPGTDFAAWAITVARYRVYEFLRSKRRQRALFSDQLIEELAATAAERDDDREARLAALATCREKLGPRERRLIDLCYGGDDSIREVARELGRPVQSVYVSLSKIRSALHDCIKRSLAREGLA